VEGTCEKGRSDGDKYTIINSLAYDQFTEAIANKQHVNTWTLQQWGMAVSFQFTPLGFPFKASARWAQDFKEHKLRYRNMTKYKHGSNENSTTEKVGRSMKSYL
jgi:hypothetical protein